LPTSSNGGLRLSAWNGKTATPPLRARSLRGVQLRSASRSSNVTLPFSPWPQRK
jgi:hypothetical protein